MTRCCVKDNGKPNPTDVAGKKTVYSDVDATVDKLFS